jgi:hypothetical protein
MMILQNIIHLENKTMMAKLSVKFKSSLETIMPTFSWGE